MKVAFDLDGVVYDMVPMMDQYFIDRGYRIEDQSSYDIGKRVGESSDVGRMLLKDFGDTRPFRNMPLIKAAKDEMELRSKYCDIYIVTFRDWTPYGVEDTLERIRSDGLPVNEKNIIFSKNKGQIAKELGIDTFYEDNLDNAIDIVNQSGSLVVLVDTPYNQSTKREGIFRIKW